MVQGGSRFSMDIPPYIIVGKEPARYMGINLIGLRRRGFSNELTLLSLRVRDGLLSSTMVEL